MARTPHSAALALAVLTLACGDAATAPPERVEDIVVVSVADVGADAAGVVLRLSGSIDRIDRIDAAHASLEVAWARDDATATVAIVGPIAELGEILIVRRPTALAPLRVEVVEVADGQGSVSLPASARTIVKDASTRQAGGT